MSKGSCLRRKFLERSTPKECLTYNNNNDKANKSLLESDGQSFLTSHLKKIYPIGLDRSTSSLSLSLSQSYNDSFSLTGSSGLSLDRNISLALRLISPYGQRSFIASYRSIRVRNSTRTNSGDGEVRRCNWITKTSDKAYIEFHDKCWGVPVHDDREAIGGSDPDSVAGKGEDEIERVSTEKAMFLAENRVRCTLQNAKCIQKVASEYGSFSDYAWSYVNYKPTINWYRYPKQVPMRSPKAESMSRDLQRRGFRLVGLAIVHLFMQAAGMTIDHLVDCYRYTECINLIETPWRHI